MAKSAVNYQTSGIRQWSDTPNVRPASAWVTPESSGNVHQAQGYDDPEAPPLTKAEAKRLIIASQREAAAAARAAAR